MAAMEDEPMEEDGMESIENLEDTKGAPIREWVARAAPRREVYNRFRNFLRTVIRYDIPHCMLPRLVFEDPNQ